MTLYYQYLIPTVGKQSSYNNSLKKYSVGSSKIISSLELGDNSEKQAILTKYKRKGGENNVENHILENKGRGNKRR